MTSLLTRRMSDSLPPLQIDAQKVHLWHAFVAEQDLGRHAMPYFDLLSAQEREQHRRFYFEKDRNRYLVTRALVRTVLSRYASVGARDWRFETNAYGRPHIANSNPQASRLRFNTSHTDSLVVLALTADRDIGVDVESTSRTAPLDVADRFFSPREAVALRQLPAQAQALRFWDLWTFKESYIKARSMGLSIPLERFSFYFSDAASVEISFEEGLGDSPSRWDFWQFKPDAEHLVAVCLARTSAEPIEFVCRRFVPSPGVDALASTITRSSKCGDGNPTRVS